MFLYGKSNGKIQHWYTDSPRNSVAIGEIYAVHAMQPNDIFPYLQQTQLSLPSVTFKN